MKFTHIKIHFTHKWAIQRLYKDGFTDEELAIMYKIPWPEIKRITRGLKNQPIKEIE